MEQQELKYLKLLSEKFPTIQEVCTEIINLKAIQNLPKSTEHFLSDLHGEYESFLHILKNASGVIKTKIDENFEYTMTSSERRQFATLIYYTEKKLKDARRYPSTSSGRAQRELNAVFTAEPAEASGRA